MKIFVLEKTETRITQENRQYGITHILAKTSNYQELHEFSMPQKWIAKLNTSVNKSLIIRGYAMKEDGGIRISEYSTVSILQDLYNQCFPQKIFDAWGWGGGFDRVDAQPPRNHST